MIEITGKDAKGFEQNESKKIGDLARTENGKSLIRVYSINTDPDPIIWVRVDSDANGERWLVFPIKPEYIEAYLNGEITGDELMISGRGPAFGKEYYFFDVKIDITALKVHNEDIPAEYHKEMNKFYAASPDEAAIREYLRTLQ